MMFRWQCEERLRQEASAVNEFTQGESKHNGRDVLDGAQNPEHHLFSHSCTSKTVKVP